MHELEEFSTKELEQLVYRISIRQLKASEKIPIIHDLLRTTMLISDLQKKQDAIRKISYIFDASEEHLYSEIKLLANNKKR